MQAQLVKSPDKAAGELTALGQRVADARAVNPKPSTQSPKPLPPTHKPYTPTPAP